MNEIHTHYDNLKVTRNAPPEVIRAAYKTLSQKYHPDKHPGVADAERVMALINESFQFLSDPVKRADHDRWIAQQEQVDQSTGPSSSKMSSSNPEASRDRRYEQAPAPRAASQSSAVTAKKLIRHVFRYWLLYAIVGFLVWSWATHTPTKPAVGPKPYQANPVPVDTKREKPALAPNGQPWPIAAGYVKGYPQLNANGLSTVTVDNSQNDSEVFVKLVSLDGAQAFPVRQFFIPAFTTFALKKVSAGSYDIRYRDLISGGLSRSEAFTLIEERAADGTRFSNMRMTLYKVNNGNMQTYRLSEVEF